MSSHGGAGRRHGLTGEAAQCEAEPGEGRRRRVRRRGVRRRGADVAAKAARRRRHGKGTSAAQVALRTG